MSELICTCHCGGTMFYRHLHASDCPCATQGDEVPESHPDTIAALRATITQQAQELEKLQGVLGANEVLVERLAAMTTERDKAVKVKMMAYKEIEALMLKLAASQARVKELEAQWHYAATHDADMDYVKEIAQLQATLAAREARIQDLERGLAAILQTLQPFTEPQQARGSSGGAANHGAGT